MRHAGRQAEGSHRCGAERGSRSIEFAGQGFTGWCAPGGRRSEWPHSAPALRGGSVHVRHLREQPRSHCSSRVRQQAREPALTAASKPNDRDGLPLCTGNSRCPGFGAAYRVPPRILPVGPRHGSQHLHWSSTCASRPDHWLVVRCVGPQNAFERAPLPMTASKYGGAVASTLLLSFHSHIHVDPQLLCTRRKGA